MQYIIDEFPSGFESFFEKFDPLFNRPNQRRNFRRYLTGLLLELKRKNIQSISERMVSGNYQALHHFLAESPWDEGALNTRRIDILQASRQTKSTASGILALDDTANPKANGSKTYATAPQYAGCLGKVATSQVVVTSHYADYVKHWPIELNPYVPARFFPKGKKDAGFKPKTTLALELIDAALRRRLSFKAVIFDEWYGKSAPFLAEIEKRNLVYVTPLKPNRKVYIKLPGDVGSTLHHLRDVVTIPKETEFVPVQIPRKNGSSDTKYVWAMRLKIKGIPGKRWVVIEKPTPQETDIAKIEFYLSNAPDWPPGEIVLAYHLRYFIDQFYGEGKDDLGFDQYQVRKDRRIRRHWYLVFTAYSFLLHHRLKGSITSWCTKKLRTIGELLRLIRHRLFLKLFSWLERNMNVFKEHLQLNRAVLPH
jgi:hypothetical protein